MHISISPEPIFQIGSLVVTNSLLTSLLVSLLLSLIGLGVFLSSKMIPSTWQNLVESIIEPLYLMVEEQSHAKAKRFFPLVATLFLFILFSNWSGLVPGVGSIGFYRKEAPSHHREFVPLFRGGTADLNTTLALALVAVMAIQFYGIKDLGLRVHVKKYLNFSGPIEFFVGILELISEFAKIISFAFRLFGNIFAGEVLLAVMAGLIPIIVPLPFLGLEIFVGFIQALVFAMLTLVFVNIATAAHAESD